MKKIALFILSVFACTAACFAQDVVTLDAAIEQSFNYLVDKLDAGAKVGVLNITAPTRDLTEYIIDEMSEDIVNDGRLLVVDRRNMELIKDEMNFQLSGDVSDESAQRIGQKLGAKYIILGAISNLGSFSRMRIQAISVETAEVRGMINTNVANDAVMKALLAGKTGLPAGAEIPAGENAAYAKPVKKIPAKQGNFEIILGRRIKAPIDMEKFREALLGALTRNRYRIKEEGSGYIIATLGNSWWFTIKCCYWTDEYWFEYVDSYKLSADPARNVIHRNYGPYILKLDAYIDTYYKYPSTSPLNGGDD